MAPGPCQLPRVHPCGIIVPSSAKANGMFGQPTPRQISPCRWQPCRRPCRASQTACPFALHQTSFCVKHQGTRVFDRASFTTSLVQSRGWSCTVCYSDDIPWLWDSYTRWPEMSCHLHGFPMCPNSCDLAWNLPCLRQLLWSLSALQEQSSNLKSYFLLVIPPRRTELLFLIPLTEFSHLFPFAFSNRLFSHICAIGRVWPWLTAACCLFAYLLPLGQFKPWRVACYLWCCHLSLLWC